MSLGFEVWVFVGLHFCGFEFLVFEFVGFRDFCILRLDLYTSI